MLPHLMDYIHVYMFLYNIYIQREEREEREERRDKARRGEERDRERQRETSLEYIIYWGANTFPISRIKSKYLKPPHFLEQIM